MPIDGSSANSGPESLFTPAEQAIWDYCWQNRESHVAGHVVSLLMLHYPKQEEGSDD